MNLQIHGCIGVEDAKRLCDLGMAIPERVLRSDARGEPRTFEAIELGLQAIIEIGRIEIARAVKHPFVAAAFTRMDVDQFAEDDHVVFSVSYLERAEVAEIKTAWLRSAVQWHP
ncbi:hypothetical protein SAMN05519105_2478 [Rhodobacter sp. 24-YEA-8]|nr:hypothetical protein SAMN05519105_2478 [Rhodobacter sp. 24-YEA-8]